MQRLAMMSVAVGLAAIGTVYGGCLARSAAPDAVLAAGFGEALAATETTWTSSLPNVWLSGAGAMGQAIGKALAIGDVITIKGKGGAPEMIEVTGLEHVDGGRIGLAGVQFQLVTGRSVGDRNQGLVRFLFATDGPGASIAPRRAPDAAGRML